MGKFILQKHLTKDILALYQSEGYPNITKLSFKQLWPTEELKESQS